jgi:hypothetical protein
MTIAGKMWSRSSGPMHGEYIVNDAIVHVAAPDVTLAAVNHWLA